MKLKKYIIILATLIFIFYACEDRSDLTAPVAPNTGTADFSKFISIGNSLTAGTQNGALYESAQNYSFGKMIANQVGVEYVQPIISDPGIGGRIEVASLTPFSTNIQPVAAGDPQNLNYQGIYNNIGIPGIVLADVLNTTASPSQYSRVNPLIDIVLRNQGRVIDLALASQPTFITLWIGNNDILGYATSGGVLPYTQAQTFAFLYDKLCDTLAVTGAKVVVANIPNVTSIPFFTTVNGQLLLSGTTAVYGRKSDSSVAVMNLTENLLTLRAQLELAQGKGTSSTNPLSDNVILDKEEIAIAQGVIQLYNTNIKLIAESHGFKLLDMNKIFNEIAATGLEGKEFNGIKLSTVYLQGGLFSLDGVHPTTQGYGIIANEFLKVINAEFNSSIPLINISTLPGSIYFSAPAGESSAKLLRIPNFPEGAFDNILY